MGERKRVDATAGSRGVKSSSVYESSQRILADDGTWTKGDAEACARFCVGAIEDFRRKVAEAHAALGAGDEAVVRYLRGESAPSYNDVAEGAERESRQEGYRFSSEPAPQATPRKDSDE